MKKVLIFILIIVFAISLLMGCQNGKNKGADNQITPSNIDATKKFSIGAASPGGGFYMGASALATVVNSKLPGYEANVEVTGASANNAALVHAGEVEMGMCATEVAWEAYNGKFDFESKKCDKIRSVLPGWSGVYMFITTEDKGITSIEDIQGKSWSGGPKGSSNEIITNRVIDLLDINVKSMNLPTSDASRSLGDGTIDGFTLAHPASAVLELEATKTVKLLTIDEKHKSEFAELYPQYIWLDIPAGYYKALPNGAHGAGLYNMLISSSDQDEEFVYQVVKAAYENNELIKTIFPQLANEMGLENVECSTIPYHKGAIKYFKEVGIEIPENLIPPEMK